MRQKEEDRAMNVEYWKPLVEEYEGRTIQAEYARDDAYVRVRVSGGAEDRMKHGKKQAEGAARLLLRRMAADGKA
jgi:hypothetical protein